MNFDNNTPIDTLLGRLLAFIIMFQKKIQFLKCKLAGNQQFHTRLAFQMLDVSKKNQISSEQICQALNYANISQSQSNCAFFVRRYSKNNGITYEQFLKLISPKANKSLSQRMMIRTYKKGSILQDYIYINLLQLLSLYIKMSVITENIRKSMQSNQDLSHLEIIQFFHIRISNSNDLITFINMSQSQNYEQYDIQPADAVFLSYHINSGNQIRQFDDLDIKQLICPIDMNFQKHNQTKNNFYNTYQFKDNQKINPKKTSTGINFLGKTYQKIYQKQSTRQSKIQKQGLNQNIEGSLENRGNNKYYNNNNYNNNNRISSKIDHYSIIDQSYRGMYIDNFTKSTVNDRLQINKYAQYSSGRSKFQVFQDDLQNNSSVSKQSAFDRS